MIAAEPPQILTNLLTCLTALKAIWYCSIVLIRRNATTVTGTHVLRFITEEIFTSSCFSDESKCEFTPKGMTAEQRCRPFCS